MNSTLVLTSNFTTPTMTVNQTPLYTTEQSKAVMTFLNTWYLAPAIIFGCSGNILNLMVLLHKTMRSRTNMIFAAMAVSDLAFLLLHFTTFLFFLGPGQKSQFLRDNNSTFAALINWCSAVSIWLMTYATLERVQVIRSPFGANTRTAVSMRFIFIICIICVTAFVLTGAHFLRDSSFFENRSALRAALMILNAGLVVIGPLGLCTLLNWRLVKALKMNNRCWNSIEFDDNAHNQSLIQSRAKTERKVTLVVCVIISCFVVFNMPGAILYIYRELAADKQTQKFIGFALAATICNTMTVTGKVLNFVLFCLTSEHFRKLLRERCTRCYEFPRRSSSRSQRTTTIALETV